MFSFRKGTRGAIGILRIITPEILLEAKEFVVALLIRKRRKLENVAG